MGNEPISKETLQLLRELSEAFGVSGFESEVRDRIRAFLTPLVDTVSVDPMGNLHAVVNPEASFTLMLDAHMDEVGFMVRSIEEGGFLRLAPIGGWDVRILPGQAVVVRGSGGDLHWGVIGSLPPHVQEGDERKKVFEWKDLFVDIGAEEASEVMEMGIRVGSPAVMPQSLRFLGDRTVLGKALDDRAGCFAAIKILEALSSNRPNARVVANFAVSEEVGYRGAGVAARQLKPDMALILEGTTATDTPGVRSDQRVSALGKGPALTAADRSMIVPERLLERIISVANENEIPYQIKTPMTGSTDGGVIQVSHKGVLTAVIAVPCRYIHSHGSIMRVDDLLNTVRLAETLTRQSPQIYEDLSEN